jgi:predicted acylesterase/phospholipase RssA
VYELGVLRALEESIEGLDFNDLDIYVGVSAGAFVCAHLANGVTVGDMARSIVVPPFIAERFMSPALGEFVRRGARIPWLLLEAFWQQASHPGDLSLLGSLAHLSRALPVALFDGDPIQRYLAKSFALPGRSNDFRTLRRKFVVVAADLDSGQAVRFGEPPFEHVPISVAVQASSALPGLYAPVRIDGRDYVDGVLLKTLHASVALDAGTNLVVCINPIVPVDAGHASEDGHMVHASLADEGLPLVMSQTFRTLIHSRLTVGMAAYEPRYPDQDILLFEPQRDDYRMFFTNVFSFESRKLVCEHAYDRTRRSLLARAAELEPIFREHGLRLRTERLIDTGRDLWTGLGVGDARSGETATETLDRLLDRLEALVDLAPVRAAAARRDDPVETP